MVIELRTKEVKSALNRQSGGFLNTYTHSLQPYTGCAFGQSIQEGQGCPYCYVRKLPVALFAGEPWGEWVEAKLNIAAVLRRELAQAHKRNELCDFRIFMSSATDPYQGAESTYGLTRQCLEVFLEFPPGLLVVQTRSPLVTRDIDILGQFGSSLWVSMTIETNDDEVRKRLTPTSPTVTSRLRAMANLKSHGIQVQAAVSPMLPNNPALFAQQLKDVCDRVVVDTLFHGDGANGRRSDALGMATLYGIHGYGDWYRRDAHVELLDALRQELGDKMVTFSQDGFNSM